MILSTFSCIYWPFVYLLWRKAYSNPLNILKLGYLCFFGWVVRAPYTFWLIDPYQIHDLHIFLPLCGLNFHFLDNTLWNIKDSNFDEVHFIYFSPDAHAFGVISKKLLPNLRSWRFTPMFFYLTYFKLCYLSIFYISL